MILFGKTRILLVKTKILFGKTKNMINHFENHLNILDLLCFLFLLDILFVCNILRNLRNLPLHNFGNLYKVRHLNCLLLAMFDYTGMIFWETIKIQIKTFVLSKKMFIGVPRADWPFGRYLKKIMPVNIFVCILILISST